MEFYWKNHEVTFKITTTKWGKFTMLAFVIYMYHLCWAMSGCSMYSDWSREIRCGQFVKQDGATETSTQDQEARAKSSAVYDMALFIATIYHIIEWVRWTLLITTALINSNLIRLFNLTGLNYFLGVASLAISMAARFSEDGVACAGEEFQSTRGLYLILQILCFVLSHFFTFANILFMYAMKNEWCHEQYLAEEEEEDD